VTLLLNNDDVRRLLTPANTREALETAYRELIDGDAVCRPRVDIRIPTHTPGRFYQWGTMEGGSTSGYFAIRMKSDVVYEQEYQGVRTQEKFASRPGLYCGLVLLTDIDTGVPLALINDGYLQHLRVAADSAIGTNIMARRNAHVLGMLGSGGMAHSHLDALLEVREIKQLRVFSPTPEHRAAYAAQAAQRFGIEAVAVDDPRAVYRGADILAACTDSATPVIRGDWLEPGMHVISIGGRPDAAAQQRFDVVLRFGNAPAPIGRADLATTDEYLGYAARPDDPFWNTLRAKGRAPRVARESRTVMLADVLRGKTRGRSTDAEITYSERGNIQGAQFFAVAGRAYELAKEKGLGREIPTDWLLQDIRD